MQNVASRDLCEKLHTISGWEQTYFYHYETEEEGWIMVGHLRSTAVQPGTVPAYELGYMMNACREQDVAVSIRYVGIGGSTSMDLKDWYGKFVASTPHMKQGDYPFSDTPEDAMAELMIMLFEQGVLQRDEKIS